MKIHAYVKRLAGMTLWLLAAPAVLILSAEDTPLKKISVEEYQDKVYGSWLAQCIGNVYGLPHENDYIEEPGPEAFPYGYQGNLERLKRTNGVFSDDDTDIEYMYLLAMEKHGPEPTLAELAAMWKYHVRNRVWLANRAAVAAMNYGFTPPVTGQKEFNPHWFSDRSAAHQRDLGGYGARHGALRRREIRVGGADHGRRLGNRTDRLLRRHVRGGLFRARCL